MSVCQPERLRSKQAMIRVSVAGEQQNPETSFHPPCGAIATGVRLKTSEELQQQQAILFREQQSQKLVQELIGAAIGCITYLRGLVPENSFCDMVYGSRTDDIQSQNGQVPVSQESITDLAKKEYRTRIKGIQRGFSPEADTLLDWMEQGIFCALNKGYLRAFQLAIFLDPDNPNLIQEAYTFSIQYHRGEFGKSAQVEGIAITKVIQNGESHPFAPELLDITHVRRSVKALIRRLIVITQNLDLLPEKRYLTIRLYHTSDTPENWTPPMFTQSSEKSLSFDKQSNHDINDDVFGVMETGLHSVQIRVTAVKRSLDNAQGNIMEPDENKLGNNKRQRVDSAIQAAAFIPFAVDSIQPRTEAEDNPRNICYAPSSSSTSDINTDPQKIDIVTSQDYGSRDLVLVDKKSPQDSQLRHSPLLSGTTPPYQAIDQEHEFSSTQTDSVAMHSQSVSSSSDIVLSLRSLGDGCSNPIFSVARNMREQMFSISQSTGENSQQSILSSQGIGGACLAVSQLQLNDDKLCQLRRPRDQRRNGTADTAKATRTKCECGSTVEGPDQIQCDMCNNWQHCECYGFTGHYDPRIGDFHICYTCLLSKDEVHLLQQMKSFAISRRLVRYLMRDQTCRSLYEITKEIAIPKQQQQTVAKIIALLVQKDYLETVNRRRVVTKRTPNKYRLIQTDDVLRRLEEDILDPLINITHHYELPDHSLATLDRGTEISQMQGEPQQPTDVEGSAGEDISEDSAEAAYGQVDRPLGIQTPISMLRTSDALGHLKAGDWT